MRSSASSFNFRYLIPSLRTFYNCLPLLPCLPVISILPSVFRSVTYLSRQLLHKISPIQLALLVLVVRMIFLSSLTLCNTSFLTRSVQLIPIFYQHHISHLPRCILCTFRTAPVSAQYKAMHFTSFFLYFEFNLLVKRVFVLLNAAFSMAILELMSRVHLASYVIMLPKY